MHESPTAFSGYDTVSENDSAFNSSGGEDNVLSHATSIVTMKEPEESSSAAYQNVTAFTSDPWRSTFPILSASPAGNHHICRCELDACRDPRHIAAPGIPGDPGLAVKMTPDWWAAASAKQDATFVSPGKVISQFGPDDMMHSSPGHQDCLPPLGTDSVKYVYGPSMSSRTAGKGAAPPMPFPAGKPQSERSYPPPYVVKRPSYALAEVVSSGSSHYQRQSLESPATSDAAFGKLRYRLPNSAHGMGTQQHEPADCHTKHFFEHPVLSAWPAAPSRNTHSPEYAREKARENATTGHDAGAKEIRLPNFVSLTEAEKGRVLKAVRSPLNHSSPSYTANTPDRECGDGRSDDSKSHVGSWSDSESETDTIRCTGNHYKDGFWLRYCVDCDPWEKEVDLMCRTLSMGTGATERKQGEFRSLDEAINERLRQANARDTATKSKSKADTAFSPVDYVGDTNHCGSDTESHTVSAQELASLQKKLRTMESLERDWLLRNEKPSPGFTAWLHGMRLRVKEASRTLETSREPVKDLGSISKLPSASMQEFMVELERKRQEKIQNATRSETVPPHRDASNDEVDAFLAQEMYPDDDGLVDTNFRPDVNVWDFDSKTIVCVTLPGAKREDVHIELKLDGQTSRVKDVVIKGRVDHMLKEVYGMTGKLKRWHRTLPQRQTTGDFITFASMPLAVGEELDGEKVKAVLRDGILTIELEKVKSVGTKVDETKIILVQ